MSCLPYSPLLFFMRQRKKTVIYEEVQGQDVVQKATELEEICMSHFNLHN